MEFKDIIEGRRTVRLFKQIAPSEEQLNFLLEAARNASCSGNQQKVVFAVVTSPDKVRDILYTTSWAGLVSPKRTPVRGVSAPLCFIAAAAPVGSAGNMTLHADVGAALMSMELAAYDVGLGCCWIGSFKKVDADKILELPDGMTTLYLLAVGVPDEKPVRKDVKKGESVKYFLDENDVLHVPKLVNESISVKR